MDRTGLVGRYGIVLVTVRLIDHDESRDGGQIAAPQ